MKGRANTRIAKIAPFSANCNVNTPPLDRLNALSERKGLTKVPAFITRGGEWEALSCLDKHMWPQKTTRASR